MRTKIPAFPSSNSVTSERGVALIVTLFALLLLTVVGMGMLLSAGTESTIHANYRDKQTALFGAMAGLQEARDRIQPATLNITPPTALPDLGAANIIYIINPKSGETVAPWDINNRYADTELCQESVLGLTPNPGAQCTSLPTGSSWYTVKDDSLSAAGVWQNTTLGTPLDLKWVRIQLKANNNTPVPASGVATDATQVCWDGIHQVLLPSGYDPNCVRFGSVAKVIPTDGGFGYTSTPTVTIDPPTLTGIQATAHAVTSPVTSAQVQSVTMVTGGSGYTEAPIVTFTGGGGAGATAIASFVPPGAAVASVSLSSAGTACYAVEPAVSFTGGGGAGAAATSTLASTYSCVAGWTVSGSCSSKKGNTVNSIGLSGGGGSGFSGTISFSSGTGAVSSVTIQNPGTGYTGSPTAITNLTGCPALTFTVNLGKLVQSLSLTAGGSGYTSTPTVSLTTGTGTAATQPTGSATLGPPPANAGQVTGVTITNGGSGYTSAPAVTFTSLSGMGASANATIGTVYSKVDSIVVDNHGKGYTVVPNVTISGGGGTGATARAVLGGSANWGKVYLLTALAETKSGARAFLQMETTTPVTGFAPAAAMVIDGPNPSINNMPNSDQFVVSGYDANSCHDAAAEPPSPAVGGYDDPNSDPPTNSVQTIVDSLPRPDHYIGDGGTPSVQNVWGALGETLSTPTGLKAYIEGVRSQATNLGNAVTFGSASNPAINYIEGDATINGNGDGYGILVVTGTLQFGGDFHWHGTVLVVGDGIMDFNGGGEGTIQGMLLVAKIWDSYTTKNVLSTMGSPSINWDGGGNNGVYYDHCLVTDLMGNIQFDPPPSTRPLKVLSLRTLPY